MHLKLFRWFSLVLIFPLSVSINSCNSDNKDDPEPEESNVSNSDLTIVGKWTFEDYRTGEYFTFDFKNNGEYTLLQPFYDRMDKAAGRYKYDPKTKSIYFEHYYNDDDFKDHGEDPSFGTSLSVQCKLDENTLTLIGEDCEEFGFTNPVVLNKGGYTGVRPDFRSLLCSLGEYESTEDTYEGYEGSYFKFYSSGEIEYIYCMVINYPDGTEGYGYVYAQGTFSVDQYMLNCYFPTILKLEDNLGYASSSIWDKASDGKSLNLRFYLALDEDDSIIINENPIYK